jgi:hypothetical protein
MYILAQLVLVNYIPEKFERNMIFKSPSGEVYGFIYTTTPLDKIIELNGYPVKPYIMPISANPDDSVQPLAQPEQIGWWDDGPQSDELRDITNSDLTNIMLEEDGLLQIEVEAFMNEDGEELIRPILYNDKVTIGFVTNDDDWDITSNDGLEEEEDWDDMDDEPEFELGGSE